MPYAAADLAGQLLSRLDILLVLWLLTLTDQGHYAVAIAAAGLMMVVPNALALFAFNVGAKQQSEWSVRKLVTAGLGVLLIQALCALGLAIILHLLLPLMFGEEFAQAIPMTLVLLPGLAIDGVAIVADRYLRGRGRPLSTLRPRFIGAATLVLLAFLLFPTWKALSIPIAASAGHSIAALATFWVVIRHQKVTPDEN